MLYNIPLSIYKPLILNAVSGYLLAESYAFCSVRSLLDCALGFNESFLIIHFKREECMPDFYFKTTDENSLLDKMIIQDKVLTMFFNFKLAETLHRFLEVDVRLLVQRTDRHGKQYTFIHDKDKAHDNLHAILPLKTELHHHFLHTATVGIADIMHLVGMHQALIKDFVKDSSIDACFISKKDHTDLYNAFELYVKFSSLKKTATHVVIRFNEKLSPGAYLPRLKQILDHDDETPSSEIIKVNAAKTIYYFPFFWLKDIGKGRREIAQNLNLQEVDFLPTVAKK
jgi:hypothetical protein